MEALNWEKLLSPQRERASSRKIGNDDSIIARNEFEADYDRIVGSSSVRRLQDKAQVFPLQENDVARTRLTHSIEVSALARSLGKAVGKQLEKRNVFTRDQTEELAALLQVAGLIHDLGNPPFGHYGEDVIRNWFDNWFSSNPVLATHNIVLTEQEQYDFRYFDGNVQNLRIVSKLQTQNDIYGANFTFATLGTIMKYPWQSNKCPDGKMKFGYFKSEAELATKVRFTLGLNENIRHPATYLLEAADDIIYLCDDIEDGAKKGCINWSNEFDKIRNNLTTDNLLTQELSELFDSIQNKSIDSRMDEEERETARVRNFRNYVQTFLFTRAIDEFLNRYDDIMSNDYTRVKGLELLNCESGLVRELKRVTAENCFSCREVLELELAGHTVIDIIINIKNRDLWVEVLKKYELRSNRFGGHKLICDGLLIDTWPIEQTWAFREKIIDCSPAQYVSMLPETVFLNIDGILYDWNQEKWYDTKYQQAVATKHLTLFWPKTLK